MKFFHPKSSVIDSTNIYKQFSPIKTKNIINCFNAPPAVFHAKALLDQLREFINIIQDANKFQYTYIQYTYYAIIRSATTKKEIVEELQKIQNFSTKDYLDVPSAANSVLKIETIGEIGDIKFYYITNPTIDATYSVDFGIRFDNFIALDLSNQPPEKLTATFVFNRKNKEVSAKEKFEEETTKILKKTDDERLLADKYPDYLTEAHRDFVEEIDSYASGMSKDISDRLNNSKKLQDLEYETKLSLSSNVNKKTSLPESYISIYKGFYKKEDNEIEKLSKLSDYSILNYKLEKMLEFSSQFKQEDLYTKQEHINLRDFKSTYIDHIVINENKIPFILVKSLSVPNYFDDGADIQQIQEKSYSSIYELLSDLKNKQKSNIIFIKEITKKQYVEGLNPSLKNYNECKIMCAFLPKK